MSDTRTYNSTLRQEQAEGTREKILEAMRDIVREAGALEAATNRAVAKRAGVTEMTVYRHFPSRDQLMQGLWAKMNREGGVTVGLPDGADDILGKLKPLFRSFDARPEHIIATLRTPQGVQMRASLDEERRQAFLAATQDLAGGLAEADQAKAAAVLQLLYSAYAWISLREQWGITGDAAADAVGWAAEVLMADLRTRGATPIQPAETAAPNDAKAVKP